MKTITIIEKIEEFLSNLKIDIDILSFIEADDINSYDDLYNAIEENNGFEVEIIYYQTAMEYLMQNDCSLQYSLELAGDMGFTPENLNSEILASLLASQNIREEFTELEDEITDFFDELEDEDEDEE